MTVLWRNVIAAIVFATAATTPALGKELRYGTYIPSGAVLFKETMRTFDEIKKATNGTLTFKAFPNSQVVNARTSFKGVASGIVDMAHVLFTLQSSALPHASMAAQAVAFANSPLAGTGATAEFHMVTCKECWKEFERAKVMPLGGEGASRYVLLCSKRMKSIEDLKGLRVRAYGTMARWAKELGLIPTRLASPEVLQSMQRGVLQCSFGLWITLRAYSMWDTVKYVIDPLTGSALGAGTLWINTSTWKKLSSAHKKAILNALPSHMFRASAIGLGSEAEVIRKKAISIGIKVTDGGPTYAAKWKAFRESERSSLIALARKRNIKNPVKFVAAMLSVFEKWNKLMAGRENDRAYFEDLIRTRIIARSPLLKELDEVGVTQCH